MSLRTVLIWILLAAVRPAPALEAVPASPAPPIAPGSVVPSPETSWGPLEILGRTIPPGTARRVPLSVLGSFQTVLVAMRGVEAGPTLCVVAGIHGDELNGVAIARRLIDETDPHDLHGSLVVVPIVNDFGFQNGTRYLADRTDLNRNFPGRSRGSSAARIAHEFFDGVIRHCDGVADLHTGSLNRANLPQVRTDLGDAESLRLARGSGALHVVHSVGPSGTLRRAASEAGVPALVYEIGEPLRLQSEEIEFGVGALRTLLGSLGMLPHARWVSPVQHRYPRTHWIRSDTSGIYVPLVDLGANVAPGQMLAEVTDPFSGRRSSIHSIREGRVLGMAVGQVVIPGFALFHIGEAEGQARPADEPEPAPGEPRSVSSVASDGAGRLVGEPSE